MVILRAWSRFGALPAFPVVVGLFALAAATTALPTTARENGIAFAVVAVFVAYCVARPTQGWDVFAAVAAPNALASLAHDVLGAPRWLYFVLLPIALVWAWSIDHPGDGDAGEDEDDVDDVPVDTGRADAERPGARA